MNAGNKTLAQAGGAVKVAAISDGQPSDAGFQIVSAWLRQEGKSANGDQLYTMCRFADFVLSRAPQPPAGQQDEPEPLWCPNCGGQGSVTVPSDNGPDAYDIDADCPHCNGKQTLESAYQGVVALLNKAEDKYRAACTIAWGFFRRDQSNAVKSRLTEIIEQIQPNRADWVRDRLTELVESADVHLAATAGEATAAPSKPLVEVQEPKWRMLTLDEIDEVFERPRPYNAFVYQAKDLIDAFIAKNSGVAAPVRGLPLTEERITEVTGCDPTKPLWIAILSVVRATEIAHGISSSAPGGDDHG